jgi:hypothetical protein
MVLVQEAARGEALSGVERDVPRDDLVGSERPRPGQETPSSDDSRGASDSPDAEWSVNRASVHAIASSDLLSSVTLKISTW